MAIRLPAEWEPQSAVLLTWPRAGSDWGRDLPAVQAVFAAIGAAVTADQPLLSVCETPEHQAAVLSALEAAGAEPARLLFARAPSDDAWARDHGPLVTLDATGPVVNDFTFNGWGGKFGAANDDRLTGRLHALGVFGPVTLTRPGMVLEGGAVETDGQGTLLATRSSVITDSRNRGLDQEAVETRLGAVLGITRFLWLDHGALSGDDTDGHIDTLARFADPETLVYQGVTPDHPDHSALEAMAAELSQLRRADGEPYRLIPLPCPGHHRDAAGRTLPASFANFLITNGSVLLPTYGSPNDPMAAEVLAAVFPHRRIVPIDCRAIIRQSGSLHCLTMQLPAALRPHEIARENPT